MWETRQSLNYVLPPSLSNCASLHYSLTSTSPIFIPWPGCRWQPLWAWPSGHPWYTRTRPYQSYERSTHHSPLRPSAQWGQTAQTLTLDLTFIIGTLLVFQGMFAVSCKSLYQLNPAYVFMSISSRLVANITRCFFWLGDHFEFALLIQSLLMIIAQVCFMSPLSINLARILMTFEFCSLHCCIFAWHTAHAQVRRICTFLLGHTRFGNGQRIHNILSFWLAWCEYWESQFCFSCLLYCCVLSRYDGFLVWFKQYCSWSLVGRISSFPRWAMRLLGWRARCPYHSSSGRFAARSECNATRY